MKISLVAVVVIIVADAIVWRCGPGPWSRTRIQLVRLDRQLQSCDTRRPAASAWQCLQQLTQMSRTAQPMHWHDGFGSPLHLSVSSKCRRMPFCGAYSAGPDRIDGCGTGDDLLLPGCAAFLGPPTGDSGL